MSNIKKMLSILLIPIATLTIISTLEIKPALAAAPQIGTSHLKCRNQSNCMSRAVNVLQSMGYSVNYGYKWVWGNRGNYRVLVESVGNDRVLIVVAGPDKQTCDNIKYQIRHQM